MIEVFAAWICLLMCSCGTKANQANSVISPRDARPKNARLIRQAHFLGQNGKLLSGSAVIYAVTPSRFVLRLEGLSAPVTQNGLFVKVYTGQGLVALNAPLRSPTGDQNYFFENSVNLVKFTGVYIYSNVENINYGAALFLE